MIERREVRLTGIALAPDGTSDWLRDAIEDGGGTIVPVGEADALVWAGSPGVPGLAELVAAHPRLRWVQLPWAGVETFVDVLDTDRIWTCGKGVYATPVAELALSLLLGGLRGVPGYTRADRWTAPGGRNLVGARVVILGGGGITTEMVRLLSGFDADITVVRRHPDPVPGAARVVTTGELASALPGADGVVLALALTPETHGVIGAAELGAMESHTWLVNVARGGHVDTGALVAALAAGSIGGAGLDVTDPEPLPPGHPLWSEPRCVITPHVGNTPSMAVPLLRARVRENVRRWIAGEPLLGPVDATLGY